MRFNYKRINSRMLTVYRGDDYIGGLLACRDPDKYEADSDLLGYLDVNPARDWYGERYALSTWKRILQETKRNWAMP